jgi:AcrR family transcriptional regulator
MAPLPKDEEKRRRIIRAALEVFAHDGVKAGKISKIAEKAGIGKGTVYEYFSSKEQIFEAVFESFFNEMMSGYLRLAAEPLNPVQKIEMMFDYTYDYLDEQLSGEQGAEWMIFIELLLQGFRDELQGEQKLSISKMLRNLYDLFKPFVEEGIKSGALRALDCEHATFILFAALDGISLHYFINRPYYDKETLKKMTREIFLHGLLNTSETEGE